MSTMSPQAVGDVRINPADETIRLGPLIVRFLIAGEDSGPPAGCPATPPSVAVFEVIVPGGQRLAAPAHSHNGFEETIYGLEGVLTWTVDGRAMDVAPGQALCIPRGAVHRFDNHCATQAKVLCIVTPGVLGPQFFRESAALINAAAGAGGPPDRARMAEIMLRHGLTPAPPAP